MQIYVVAGTAFGLFHCVDFATCMTLRNQ
jgi:hypothetical protein